MSDHCVQNSIEGDHGFFSIPSASEKEIALHFSFPLDGVGGGDRRLHSAQKIEYKNTPEVPLWTGLRKNSKKSISSFEANFSKLHFLANFSALWGERMVVVTAML